MSKAKTDREYSVASSEFVWEQSGGTEAHQFILPVILKSLANAQANTVLDLGCGNGALTAAIAERGFRVTGCDRSESGITLARDNYPGVSFFQHDITEPLPESHREKYDAVVSAEVIEHLLLPRSLLNNAVFALKQGGVFVLTTPYHGYWKNLAIAVLNGFDAHWHPLRDFGHIKFFSENTIRMLFREFGLGIFSFERVGRIPWLARSMVIAGRKLAA